MVHSTAALILAATLTTGTTRAAQAALMIEPPTLHTPIARYTDGDNVVPLDFGFRTSLAFPRDKPWHSSWGYSVRGGRTAANTPVGRFRLDYGWRRVYDPRKQGRPYLELGVGSETIWFADPDSSHTISGGVGPHIGVGMILDGTADGLLGLRLTSAWMGPGREAQEEATGRSYRYTPSHLGLAVYAGQVF